MRTYFKKNLICITTFSTSLYKFIGVSLRYALENSLKKENFLACLRTFKNPRNVNCVSTHESNENF